MIRRTTAFAAALAFLTLAALLPTLAAAAPPAPAWQLNLTTTTTNLVPGTIANVFPQYTMIATNVGGATAHGPITIADTLPTGVTPSATRLPNAFDQHAGPGATKLPCTVEGQTVTCTDSGSVDPGEYMFMSIPVDVSNGLLDPSTVFDQAIVEGGGASALASLTTTVSASLPAFDFLPGAAGMSASANEADGAPATQAGGHPYQVNLGFGFPTGRVVGGTPRAAGALRNLEADLPAGMVANPAATPRCNEIQLESERCPDASQIGIIDVPLELFAVAPQTLPLYNMVAPPGTAAEFGFFIENTPEHIVGGVRAGEYRLAGSSHDVLAKLAIFNAQVQLWGLPSDESHDLVRGQCGLSGEAVKASCPVPHLSTPFLSMPTSCTETVSADAYADSWEEPGNFHHRSTQLLDANGDPTEVSGCNQVQFEPSIKAQPTTNLADSPSGLNFDLSIPQTNDLDNLATAHLKDATVTLPEGLVVNPSSANGLAGCSSAQIGIDPASGVANGAEPSCPNASKVGSVEVDTPLLEDPLPGAVYLAKPFDNPFDSLLAIYLTIDDPHTGVLVKLAGHVEPDPSTGQLRTTFADSPQLPFGDFKLDFFGGASAPLRTPLACGAHTTTSDLTPWSSPEAPNAAPSDSFQTIAEPGGGTCPSSAGAAANHPSFSAGTISPQAGAYSPFVLKLSREDGSQPIAKIDATLPPGLSGRLAGLGQCSDAALASAAAKSGNAERQSPSCPSSSQVGTVEVGAGAGPTPYYAQGTAYLSGPYKGAPISLAIITPATAGPYDLGTVVVRTALYVDPASARIHAVSDPIPTILQGIPLDVRSISLRMDRPEFTLNPTSCEPFSIAATATSAFGQGANLTSPFQVGGCSSLPFKPQLSLRLKGGTKRASHPKLIATLKAKPGEANIASAQVKLPPSAFLDQAHIRTVCTRVQFAAEACPAGSIYGTATARTPLLDDPLSGNVYLRSSNHKLPDLVVALKGPASQPIEIDLAGKTDSVKGSLRNTFEAVPDAPVSSFRLELFGGKRGLVINSRDLCKHEYRAEVKLDGQNGKAYETTPLVHTDCRQTKGRAPGRHHRGRSH